MAAKPATIRIALELAELFDDLAPPGDELELPAPATPADVMRAIGLDPDEPCLLTVDDTLVPPSQRGDVQLVDGDCVSIMPPIRGG